MKRVSFVLMIALALTAAPAAVTQQAQASAPGMTTTQQPGQTRGLGRVPQATNVRLDIGINDQSGTGQPVRKSISLLLADQSSGRVRSSGMVHQQVQRGLGPDGNPVIGLQPLFQVELNVDAAVHLLSDEKIRATITLEYTPGGADPLPANQTVRPSPLNESVTVILQSGRALVITQAADPLSDRKITVEVTATILK